MTIAKPPTGWTDQQEQHVKHQAEIEATSWDAPGLFTTPEHRAYATRRFFVYTRKLKNQRLYNIISPTKSDDNMTKSPKKIKATLKAPSSNPAQEADINGLLGKMNEWRLDDSNVMADVNHGTKNQNGALTQVIKNLTREENKLVIKFDALLVAQPLTSVPEIFADKSNFHAVLEDCLKPGDLKTPTSAIHLNAPNGSSMLKDSKDALVKKITASLQPQIKKEADLAVSVDIAVDALISSALEHGTWSTFITTLPDPNKLPEVTHGDRADKNVPLKYSAKYINGSNEDNALIPIVAPLNLSKVVKQGNADKIMTEKKTCVIFIVAIEGTESLRSASTPVAARNAEAVLDCGDFDVSSPPSTS